MHPRNRHQGRYDFGQLTEKSPGLAPFVKLNAYGDASIDFSDRTAVIALNRALLETYYKVSSWKIPNDYLCPPVPGRADYVHYLADLLATENGGHIPKGDQIRGVDIGTGANCIYPLIGHSEYGWSFIGTDIDPKALANAEEILRANPGIKTISLRLQTRSESIFTGILKDNEQFDFCMCNPPFHDSIEEAQAGTQRKWRNLGKANLASLKPNLNFGGQNAELWCKGGEKAFISRMIEESTVMAAQCLWFTTLVSKASNLPKIEHALKNVQAKETRIFNMSQGQKQSRMLAWTFLTKSQQLAWQKRWHSPAA